MYTMEKAVLLYEKMAERMEKSGKENHQAKAYRDILNMMKGYDDLEEFMITLETSPLYLAPSYAVIKDKCEAFRLAAVENKMYDVAKVYENKLIELEENPVAVMGPSFYNEAGKLKGKYLDKMQAFVNVYMSYYQLKVARPGAEAAYVEDLNSWLEKLNTYMGLGVFDGDFAQVAKLAEYRALIPSTDKGYDKFVLETIRFMTTPPNYSDEGRLAAEKSNEAWEEIKENKEEIISLLKENLVDKTKYALEIYLPPKDVSGNYGYAFEEVKDYE